MFIAPPNLLETKRKLGFAGCGRNYVTQVSIDFQIVLDRRFIFSPLRVLVGNLRRKFCWLLSLEIRSGGIQHCDYLSCRAKKLDFLKQRKSRYLLGSTKTDDFLIKLHRDFRRRPRAYVFYRYE